MDWRRDERGEYTLDLVGNRVRLLTFDEFEALERSCRAGAEHNRRARERFAWKQNHKGRKSPDGHG